MEIIIPSASIEKEARKREKNGLYGYNEYDKKILDSMLTEIKEAEGITLSGLNMIVLNSCYSEKIYRQYIEQFQSHYIKAILLAKLMETNPIYELSVIEKYSAFLQSSDFIKIPSKSSIPMDYIGLFLMYDRALSLVDFAKYGVQIFSLMNQEASLFYLPQTAKLLLKQKPEFKEVILHYLNEKTLAALYKDGDAHYSPSKPVFTHQLLGYLDTYIAKSAQCTLPLAYLKIHSK